MTRKLRFYREIDRRWYVDLPEWPGEKAALEMVCGADTMLEILGEGRGEVDVTFTDEVPEDFIASLQLEATDESGGYYKAVFKHRVKSLEVWLCNVAEWVFGEFPQYIYIK